jgi:PAS domain S-box-containing protein
MGARLAGSRPVADIDLKSPVSVERSGARLVLPLAIALGAAGFVLAEPRAAGLPGALFLLGVAVAGLVLLTSKAVTGARRQIRLSGHSPALALLDGTREALALTGREGELLFANTAYRRRFGTQAPMHALSRSEAEAAQVFRLLKAGLDEGRAEGAFHGKSIAVKLEQAVERDGGTGLIIWRIAGPNRAEMPLLTDRRKPADKRDDVLILTDADLAPEKQAGRVLSVAGRIVDEAPVGIVLLDPLGTILEANQAFGRMAGVETAEGQNIGALVAEADAAEIANRLAGTGDFGASLDLRFSAGPGPERTAQLYLTRLDGAPDRPVVLAYAVETTEQKNLELQFAQSQKMQAVGQLAGGIAHDFNNTLQAIIGFCELLLMHHPAGDPSFADIDQIRQNATRAAGLVRQLLAFSRQQTLMPTVLWLPDIIADNRTLLKRLLGEKVNLEIKHERDLGLVRADETQLIQVLMNLAVNARDAMPEGGSLIIRTANISRAEALALGHELMKPDDYVLIEVTDTGCGIPKELLGKIFEPFFTTKAKNANSGLGLATVYGIARQNGGLIRMVDEPGRGATFDLLFPRCHGTPERRPGRKAAVAAAREGARILLVEDNDELRRSTEQILAEMGFAVSAAANGPAAIEMFESAERAFQLLLTDVVMPGMNGSELAEEILSRDPAIRVLYASGYTGDVVLSQGVDEKAANFLPKPFSARGLSEAIDRVLSAG